jgi:hypothetical protein
MWARPVRQRLSGAEVDILVGHPAGRRARKSLPPISCLVIINNVLETARLGIHPQ